VKECEEKDQQTEIGEEYFNERPTLISRIEELEAANTLGLTEKEEL
jgi:hypothetical protein